jgi:translation initiation factor 2B subunit (eIF-2B alpha/beta/delta family)
VYEGLELASELASANIDTTVVADAALVNELQDADIVLVGADAIASSGIINKIGTRGVAIAAASYAIPVYVLCGTEKLVPIEYELRTRVERDPSELYGGQSAFNVKNYYFESTPLTYIDVVATESGWKRETDIRDMLRTHHLHTDLLT